MSPWLGHLTGTPLCSAQKWGTLHVHKKWASQCEPWSSPRPSHTTLLSRLAPLSPRASPVDQNISPLIFWGEEGRQKGFISYKLIAHNQAFKKQSQKRMRRNKQHTFFELTHPNRDRQAGRPLPTPRLYDPLQPLTTWSPSLTHTPRVSWGVVTDRQLSPRS